MELPFRLMFGSDFKSYTAVNIAPLPSTLEWYEISPVSIRSPHMPLQGERFNFATEDPNIEIYYLLVGNIQSELFYVYTYRDTKEPSTLKDIGISASITKQ